MIKVINIECLRSCDKISNIDLNANNFQYKSQITDTHSPPKYNEFFPYEYSNYFFRNCSDSQKLEILGNKIIYFLEYTVEEKKICSENCQKDEIKKYRNPNNLYAMKVVKKLHIN